MIEQHKNGGFRAVRAAVQIGIFAIFRIVAS